MNGWHNVVHVVTGALALSVAGRQGAARTFAIAFGAVYVAVTVLGAAKGDLPVVLGLVSVNAADDYLPRSRRPARARARLRHPPRTGPHHAVSDPVRAQRIAAVMALVGAGAAVAATVASGLRTDAEGSSATVSAASVAGAPALRRGAELDPNDPVLTERPRTPPSPPPATCAPPGRTRAIARGRSRGPSSTRAGGSPACVRGTDFPTASVVGVSAPRGVPGQPRAARARSPAERGLLEPTITWSDNGAATRACTPRWATPGLWRWRAG